MEEKFLPENTDTCKNCNLFSVEPGYPTPLCAECRQRFIRFPIPLWIKLFGGALAVIIIFSLFSLSGQFSTGIHLQRGKKAAHQHRFHTARKELQKVLKSLPDSKEAQGYLMISSFYNSDFESFAKMYEKLNKQIIEDQDLLDWLNKVSEDAAKYFPTDSFMNLLHQYGENYDSIPDAAYEAFIRQYPDDIFVSTTYAARLMNKEANKKEAYKQADSLLMGILKKNDEYVPALRVLAALKREEGDLDRSLEYCNDMIGINTENPFALSTKARTLLKQHKDKEALDLALSAYDIDKSLPYNYATLCIAYHFNNKKKERDELLRQATTDSTNMEYMQYAIDIINQKEKFR